MNKGAENLLAALNSREKERMTLYKNLRGAERQINGMIQPEIYVRKLILDVCNYLVETNRYDIEIKRAVSELLEESKKGGTD